MVNRRMLLSLVLSTSMVLAGGIALAKNQHHSNGHNVLGAKLKSARSATTPLPPR